MLYLSAKPGIMKIKLFFLLFIYTVCFTSCSSCCHNIVCSNNNVSLNNIGLINFNEIESDTIILRRFAQGSNFQTLIDSVLLDSNNSRIDRTVADTVVYNYYLSNSFTINSGYDYEIYVPATNTLAKVDNFFEPQSVQRWCAGSEYPAPTSCPNPIRSVNVNGVKSASDFLPLITIYK
jgi:hypothetical protein